MRITRLFPRTAEEGSYMETLAIFAARRDRTLKKHDDLMYEVNSYSLDKRKSFLQGVVHQDWALDVIEIPYLVYDWEDIPLWCIVQLLRHRIIARDFSLEQLSQRAIKITQIDCSDRLRPIMEKHIENVFSMDLSTEEYRDAIPQSIMVNLVIAGNVRAFHHLWTMRSSEGHGGTQNRFKEAADETLRLAREVYSITTEKVLLS